MPLKSILKYFVKSFPTATILYILLVILTNLEFEWTWIVFALVMDVVDDFLQTGPA